MFKILRVNMTKQQVIWQDVPIEYQWLGGRGLTSTIVAKEVIPTCNAIGPLNKLIFAPGFLAATSCVNSGRISVGAKSPLTGGIKEANSGGQAGQYLAKLGIVAIILEGQASAGQLLKLVLHKNKAKIENASYLKGLGNYETVKRLIEIHGSEAAYCTIGQAGELKLVGASVAFTDQELRPTRHAGRGGLGAVMGSKGLKAVIIDSSYDAKVPLVDADNFKIAAKLFAKTLTEHPITGNGLSTYGTDILINIINEAGALPTRNFSSGYFEGAEKVSGEALNKLTVERGGNPSHACMRGCVIRCSGIFLNKNGEYVSKWPEYETVWAWGPNCGIDDLDAISRIDRLCDDFGVDTIEIGCAMAIAMESGFLKFGDAASAEKILAEIGHGTLLGRVLGSGAATMARVFGVNRVPIVKNQSMPAYDPRAIKGIGVTYATSPMGADHTAGYSVTANVLGVGGKIDPLKSKGQIELSKNLQAATAVIDSAGLCLFVAFAMLDNSDAFTAVIDMINAKFGLNYTGDDVSKLGAQVLVLEKDFNVRAGLNSATDRLPDFFGYEKLSPHNVVFDVTGNELDSTLVF